MFMIWKANHRDLFDSASLEERRQLINRLHTKLFAFVLVGLFAIFFAIKQHEFLITVMIAKVPISGRMTRVKVLLHSPWIAQIIHNIKYDTNRGLLHSYMAVMAFTRLLLPMYKFGDPSNYMENSLNYTVSMVVSSSSRKLIYASSAISSSSGLGFRSPFSTCKIAWVQGSSSHRH